MPKANTDRKQKLVNFRVTSEEHMVLRAAAFTNGSRNLSDYVRKTVLDSASGHPGVAPERDDFNVEEDIRRLQASIHLVSGLLGMIAGSLVREARGRIESTPRSSVELEDAVR